MIKYNRELIQLEDQFRSQKDVMVKIAEVYPPGMMDMELNWRSHYLHNKTLRFLFDGTRKLIWC